MVKEHEWYRLVLGTGREQVEWKGQTWHRYARWLDRAPPLRRYKEVIRGPFPTPERARDVFVAEVERKLAEGYVWASKARCGTGPHQHVPTPRGSKPWPEGKRTAPVWLSRVSAAERARVRAIVEKAKLGHRADDIMTLVRPAIRFALTSAKAPATVTTRFGGAPDLPAGFGWPMSGETPLGFIAQFRLDDLARFDLERRLPRKGLLSVFAHLAIDGSDCYAEKGRLLHHPAGSALVRTKPAHAASADGRPTRTALAAASVMLTLPAVHETAYGTLRLKDEEEQRYDEIVLPAVRKARSTPRQPGAHQLLGWPDVLTPSREVLLGQIDSDGRFGFQVGDVETLRLWIAPKRLVGGDFARTRFTLYAD
jgi:hypothetical protein